MLAAVKSLQVALCFAICIFAIAQNSASIPQAIFENYKKGASQFVAVVDYLMAGVDKAKPVEWAQKLQNDVKAMPVHFQASLAQSESEKTRLDQSTIALVSKSSETEAQIAQLQTTISSTQARVSGCEREVSLASQHVRNAEQSLATHEHEVHELEEKLRKAKEDCFLRRRRTKRCWPQWLCSAICEAISWITHSIDHARDRRNDARNARDRAVNELNQRRGQLDAARNQLSSTQHDLTAKQAQLSTTNQQLTTLRAQIAAIGAVNQGLKAVIEHIDRILVGSTVLKRFVDDLSLLDLNTLIEPLEHIGRELTSQTPGAEMVHFPKLTQEQVSAIQANLKALSEMLPNESIISNEIPKVA